MIILSIIASLILLISFSGDPIRVSGTVKDASNAMPLSRATLVHTGSTQGAVTDSLGRYEIRGSSGSWELEVRYLGYKTQKLVFDVQKDTIIHILMEQDLTVFDGVEVRSSRVTQRMESTTVETIDQNELDRLRGQTLGETLSGVVGVDMLQTGASIAKPVIRGLHSDRVITMQAGITQEGQQWGGEHAPEIDPFSPGQIQVIKGAAGVEFGIGAIGGVIQVIPRPITMERKLSGTAYLNTYTNNGQLAGSVHLEGSPSVDSKLGWRFQGSVRRAGDSRTPDYVIDNSGFSEQSVNSTIAFRTGLFHHRIYASSYATKLGIYTGAHIGSPNDLQRAIDRGRPAVEQPFSYKIKAPRQEIQHHLLSAESTVLVKKWGVFDIHYGLQLNNRKEYDIHGRFSRDVERAAFDLTLTTQSLDLRLQHYPLHGFDGKIGLQIKRQGNVRSSVGFLIPDFRSYSAGWYAFEKKEFGLFRAEAGVRLDYHWVRSFGVRSPRIEGRTDAYLQPSGAFGLIWNIDDALKAHATVGTAWRPAGINERFSYGVHHGTAQFEIGDPNLKPEQSINTELGLEWESDLGGIRFNAYNSWIKDFIQLRPDGTIVSTIRGAFPQYVYQQVDAQIRGLELSIHYHPVEWYETGVKGSMLFGEHRASNETSNEALYMMPAPSATWLHNIVFADQAWAKQNTIQLGAKAVRRQTRYPALVSTEAYKEPAPPPGYVLLDVGFSTKIQGPKQVWNLSLDLKNVLNTSYRDYLSRFRYLIDEPGRNLVIRMTIPF